MINVANFVANLQYMALGMGGIFVTIGIIVLIIVALSKFQPKN